MLAQPEDSYDQLNKGWKTCTEFLTARGYVAELYETARKVLDEIILLIQIYCCICYSCSREFTICMSVVAGPLPKQLDR